jgi:glycosyltransferase involved in cell wall biosynthesis
MNILHISSTDLRGAGSCVVALNTLLNGSGHNSKLVVVFKTKSDPNIIGFIKPFNKRLKLLMDKAILLFHKVQSRVKVGKTNPDFYFYNLDERRSNFSAEAILKKVSFKPDAIFVHWVSNFINTATVKKLAELTQAKMYWVMVDNAPITGGCHYPWECKGYQNDCSDCPALLTDSKKYVAQRNFALKKASVPANLKVLTLSTADKLRAEQCGFYKGKEAQVIFHPIDEGVFQKLSREESLQYFNLPLDKKILFFAATDLSERRKGYKELTEGLRLFEQSIISKGENPQDYLLVTAGRQAPSCSAQLQLPTRYLGYLSEPEMVKAFNAATLFVCPTLEDSGPGIVGQAMLCGTPVVAFSTGAAVDMVKTGYSGYLAQLGNSADLALGVEHITKLNDAEYAAMSQNCRATGIETCSFTAVYERLQNVLQA